MQWRVVFQRKDTRNVHEGENNTVSARSLGNSAWSFGSCEYAGSFPVPGFPLTGSKCQLKSLHDGALVLNTLLPHEEENMLRCKMFVFLILWGNRQDNYTVCFVKIRFLNLFFWSATRSLWSSPRFRNFWPSFWCCWVGSNGQVSNFSERIRLLLLVCPNVVAVLMSRVLDRIPTKHLQVCRDFPYQNRPADKVNCTQQRTAKMTEVFRVFPQS